MRAAGQVAFHAGEALDLALRGETVDCFDNALIANLQACSNAVDG